MAWLILFMLWSRVLFVLICGLLVKRAQRINLLRHFSEERVVSIIAEFCPMN